MQEDKFCHKCSTTKNISLFNKAYSKYDGLSSWCKQCNKQYYAANKKRHIEAVNKWKEENRVKVKEDSQKYYIKNKGYRLQYNSEWRKINKDKCSEYNKIWRKNNRGVVNSYDVKRRTKIKRAVPLWADTWKMKQYYILAKELSRIYGTEFHVDHIVPLQGKNVSGLHVENNLQIITKTENLKKGNRF